MTSNGELTNLEQNITYENKTTKQLPIVDRWKEKSEIFNCGCTLYYLFFFLRSPEFRNLLIYFRQEKNIYLNLRGPVAQQWLINIGGISKKLALISRCRCPGI